MICTLFVACYAPTPEPVIGLAEPKPHPARGIENPDGCPVPGTATVKGHLASGEIDELSGVAASRRHDVYWVHNDSGDTPRIFAVGQDGSDRGAVELQGAEAEDWEDITLVPTEEGDWLVVGDIGDNREKRRSVQLYRIAEPVPGNTSRARAEVMTVRYPDGPHNAETLIADPRDGGLYILTKTDDGVSTLFSVGPFQTGEVVAKAVGTHTFPSGRRGSMKTTGGDVRGDARWLAVRTYTTSWLFPITGSLGDALQAKPCEIPIPEEQQGEALAFVEGGLVAISEGAGAAVNLVPLE